MSKPTLLAQYVEKLSRTKNPESEEVRLFVQEHENDSWLQDCISRINQLFETEQRLYR